MQYSRLDIIISFPLLLIVIFYVAGCFSEISKEEAQAKTEKLFQKELNKDNIQNAFLKVYSPSQEIDWNFVGGEFQNGETVSQDNPFYTASIGKTFTSTAIAILVEQGRLDFEDKAMDYLPASVMANLHTFEGKDYSCEITIAQLLQHTSGLPDYFEGKTIDGSPNIMEIMFADTEKFWTPIEMLDFTKEKMQPLFAPGTAYSYSDTEYVLLGLIIENISKRSLHNFFEMHFFEPLKMEHTYMYSRSEPLKKTDKLSEIYAGDIEVSAMTSLSADWAGGGLVSTAGDLIKFQQALFTGKIVSEKTLATMQNWVPETQGMDYGFGLRKISFKKLFPTLPDLTAIGHSGSTGSFMFYCPELNVFLSGSLNQTEEVKNAVVLMAEILSFIQQTNK